MKKKLTYRQQEFLRQFLDIYKSLEKPLRYTDVAKDLGIGKVTAYEMLRLLEGRGLVRAAYQPKQAQHGPGRSTVLFYPTEEATRIVTNLLCENSEAEDCRQVREGLLNQLRADKANASYDALLLSLISKIPEIPSPTIFMVDMITAVILLLSTSEQSPEIKRILNGLVRVGLPKEFGLGVFSGITFFLSVLERTNSRWSSILISQLGRYEETLAHLDQENRNILAQFTREASQIMVS